MPTEDAAEGGQDRDPVLRASQLFESWLLREERGAAEPFDEFLAKHADLKGSLERLRRMDAFLREAIQQATPEKLPEQVRSKMLGDHRILREIGRGAMGIVFEAEQMSLHRKVALKVLPAHLTLNDRALQRFQREAEITARLNHRNIINIHQVGEVAGVHFISMELVEGTSLDKVIERMRRESFEGVRQKKIGDIVSVHGLEAAAALRPPPATPGSGSGRASGSKKGSSSASNKNFIESAVKLVSLVAEALEHAHRAGVIHRDVKPSNILVRPDGSPVLTDFGLAREDGLPTISHTGDFAGTPNFVSPEQAMSGRVPVDHRADIFSLGATLYELLTLEQAFPGETIHEILSRILSKQPRDPQKLNPALAPDLVTIVLKSLEKDPDRRYQSAAAFAEDLRSFIEYRPIRAKRTPTVLRALRWARREPMKAVLAAVLAIGVPLTSLLVGKLIAANAEIEAQEPQKREGQRTEAFLQLGLGHDQEAEQLFRDLLAQAADGDDVATVGLTRALLNQERHAEAESLLLERQRGREPVFLFERLRADVLRRSGRDEQAQAIEETLPPPKTALERYVEALRLLGGTSYGRERGVDSLLQERERAREAAGLLHQAILGDSERAPYYFAWAWAAWVCGDPTIAREVAEAIQEKWKDEAFARFYVGVAREVYDEQGALAAFEEAARKGPEAVEIEALQRRAALMLRRDPARAAAEFEGLARRKPERADFQTNLAVALVRSGDYAAAIAASKRAIELDHDGTQAFASLGEAQLRSGQLEAARETFAEAVKREPARAEFHNQLGFTLSELGALDDAAEELRTANRLVGGYPLALFNLANVHKKKHEYGEAIDCLLEAIDIQTRAPLAEFDLALAHCMLGFCRVQIEELEQALASFQRACELAPENPDYALLLGQHLFHLGRKEEGVEPLQLAVRARRGGELELKALAMELQSLRRYAEGLEVARLWTERFRTNAEGWNHLAWLRIDPEGDPALRDVEGALRASTEAVQLSEGRDPRILDTRACALAAKGNVDEAIETSRQALELAVDLDLPVEDVELLEEHLAEFQELSR